MRRGPRPAKGKEAKPPAARRSPKDDGAKVRDLEQRLAEALRDKSEALEQQTATADILRVISRSPTDVQPVFDTIVTTARTLTGAEACGVFLLQGDIVSIAAHDSLTDEWRQEYPRVVSANTVTGRAMLERTTVHVRDLETNPDYEGAPGRRVGIRTVLAVPMLREGQTIGAIAVWRTEVKSFSDQQIALLQTFVDQALIAIENVRLFNETKEALEQQTATSEILTVIAGSPTELQPVLDAVAERAARLCGADDVNIHLIEGELVRLRAKRGPIPTAETRPIVRTRHIGRAVLERQTIHLPDMRAVLDEFPDARPLAEVRTALATPLLREGVAIGVIQIRRLELQPFSDKQIKLLETFADQAVIAIENVRLFNELQTRNSELTAALEQQTTTAEILRVISRSQTDVQPVFDTIVSSAVRLCRAHIGAVFQFDGAKLHHVAHYNFSPEMSDALGRLYPRPPQRDTVSGRAIVSRAVVQIEDVLADREFHQDLARTTGWRSMVAVPMLREGLPIGAIVINRTEPGPFSDNQVELLKTFADQAAIAIENVRLFKELQSSNRDLTEALEQQTATSEILRVISSSPTDVQPVFDAIAQSAMRLCDGNFCTVARYDGDLLHLAAQAHVTAEGIEAMAQFFPVRPSRATVLGRAVFEAAVVHLPDLQQDAEYTQPLGAALRARSALGVPLLRDGQPIGAIAVGRSESHPFSHDQIALLQTFADQAVIAIENVRLFNETKEALDRQTATSEILRVISSSPTDLQPVFDAIAQSAGRLCDAAFGALQLFDGERLTLDAHYGISAEDVAIVQTEVFPLRPDRGSGMGRAILSRAVVHIEDIRSDPEYRVSVVQALEGFRTVLAAPMLRGDFPIGVLSLWRREVRPFSRMQIEMVQTFADQAVIAIENVRLFKELEARNRDLTTALDQQTATSEILRAITHAPTDTQPVFDAIVRSASQLCHAAVAAVFLTDGQRVSVPANYGSSPEALGAVRAQFPRPLDMESTGGMAILTRSVVQVPDSEEPSVVEFVRQSGRRLGFRSLITVPMLREGEAVGAIGVYRREPGRFSDAEVELLKTFADQAVIAIENVRLLTELQSRNRDLTDALARQTATSDILGVISRSPTDVQPVFDTIVASATKLCRGLFSAVYRYDGELIHLVAHHNFSPTALAAAHRTFPMPPSRGGATARAVLTCDVVHIPDLRLDPQYAHQALAHDLGFPSILAVPMLRDGMPIGAIAVAGAAAVPFSEEQITLLKTFADQAVIAIENVRLLTELQARTEELTRSVGQLTALGEVGRAVSSTLDLQTVLTTIVGRAVELSGTSGGVIYEHDEATGEFRLRASHQIEPELVELLREAPFRLGEGVTGRAAALRTPVQVMDLLTEREFALARISPIAEGLGYRSVLAVPLLLEDRVMGGLTVWRKQPGDFPPEVVHLLQTFAAQSSLALQNARLFLEIADKSRQLEIASQHKSEFLANMSHELRTPLNAIIGFSEVLSEKMFGELNEKQEEYSKDIHASGQHLLSLINDILDLSKIEAGRMELELTDFHLPTALDSALTLVRERAGRRSIALHTNIDNRLGQIHADERKVRQVVLNLLSNAIKFTPEGGRIEVGAVPKDGFVEVTVSDTGVGIAPEDQEAVFEEFRQVGTAAKKVEGTGLGLTLCRKFVELHGGRIWVKSELGVGSTFTFTLPVRHGE